jgi:hypothetical protein
MVRHEYLLDGFENIERKALFQDHQQNALAAIVGQTEEGFLGGIADTATRKHRDAAGTKIPCGINAVLLLILGNDCYQYRKFHGSVFLCFASISTMMA